MTHAALSPLIGPEFDEFLGAPIGVDRNGTTLSVLSALARLDVDPWQEATSLARMPREAAAERLTALIDALPREPASASPSQTSAADLVALLPNGKTANVRSSGDGIVRVKSILPARVSGRTGAPLFCSRINSALRRIRRRKSPILICLDNAFRTSTGPIPVWIARTGSCPWRTTRRRPSERASSAFKASNVSNSASTAWAINRRGPARRVSVSGSSIPLSVEGKRLYSQSLLQNSLRARNFPWFWIAGPAAQVG